MPKNKNKKKKKQKQKGGSGTSGDIGTLISNIIFIFKMHESFYPNEFFKGYSIVKIYIPVFFR